VRPERLIAERVIARLDREFSHQFRVKAVLWEREPLVATHHFQDIRNIPAPRNADIVVVILWSRLGVALPADQFKGALSDAAVTGTEWEFEDALAGARERGTPHLLVYRNTRPVVASLEDGEALKEKLEQKSKVQGFIHRWFESEDASSFTAAFQSYATPGEFQDLLYDHLQALLARKGTRADEVRWHQPPFRGLLAFEFEHAPVFFGRTRARNEVRELLVRQIGRGCAFVLVLGASGSGKSSLVKAAVLPDLTLPGMIGRVALCRRALMRPNDRPGDLLGGLAVAILSDTALPELPGLGYTADRLAGLMKDAPAHAVVPIEQALKAAGKAAQLTEIGESRLVLVIDQLEELFSQKDLTPEDREGFVQAMRALACSGLVWVIATMRSDFFDQLESLPALMELAPAEARYLLAPPDEAEIAHIVRDPAREAGVRFEFDNGRGVHLDDDIIRAAAKDRSSLPLLSFLLDQLWIRRTSHNVLTFDAHRSLNGLEGALGLRATEVFDAQPADVRAAFPPVLRTLVTVGEGPRATATARTAPLSRFPAGSAARRLIDEFLAPNARLLVADRADGFTEPHIRVAHEALLSHWDLAQQQIATDKADLQLEARLEQATARWEAVETDGDSLLLRQGLPLSEAEDLVARRGPELSDKLKSYVQASSAAWAREQERQRAEERARIEAEEAAKRERLEEREAAARQLAKRTRIALGLTILLLVFVIGLAGISWMQTRTAQLNFRTALAAAEANLKIVQEGVLSGDVRLEVARALLDTSKSVLGNLDQAQDSPETVLVRLRLTGAFSETYLMIGDANSALATAQAVIDVAQHLVQAEPRNDDHQAELASGYGWRGDARARLGNAAGALDDFRQFFEVAQRLSAPFQATARWQRALSHTYERIGDVLQAQNDLDGALEKYNLMLGIAAKMREREPESTYWPLEEARCREDIGDIMRARADFAAALEHYTIMEAITSRLFAQNPAHTRTRWTLALSHERVGDVRLKHGDAPGALAKYREFLALVEPVVARDPSNTQWLRGQAIAHERIGDALLAQGNTADAAQEYETDWKIVSELSAKDQDSKALKRDVAIAQERRGDVLAAAGHLDRALEHYLSYFKLADELVRFDPSNADWQRDLAISHQRIGDTLLAKGDASGAHREFAQCRSKVAKPYEPRNDWPPPYLRIRRPLASLDQYCGAKADETEHAAKPPGRGGAPDDLTNVEAPPLRATR
jgi:tetratricopeptide (TPR) repeat protein